MIVPMRKYLFLAHHSDYVDFLEGLRKLGVLHIREKEAEPSDKLLAMATEQRDTRVVIQGLRKREVESLPDAYPMPEEGKDFVTAYKQITEQREQLLEQRAAVNKELELLRPWGDFSIETVKQLEAAGLEVQFFVCPAKKFRPEWTKEYPIAHIKDLGPDTYFIGVTKAEEPLAIPGAEHLPDPRDGAVELKDKLADVQQRIDEVESRLDRLAAVGLPALEARLRDLQDNTQIMGVIEHTRREADEQLMVLEGFAPEPKTAALEALCEREDAPFFSERPDPGDKPPVLLRNAGFSRLFEPIGRLFALPDYRELDLTPYFAPFFMMFFGFCLGDAGYGLVLVLAATLYKFRAGADWKPILSLVQWLGVATILFGALTGTVFGLNLLEDRFAALGAIQEYILDSNQAFQLALILGVVQILFGLGVRAYSKGRQHGWAHAIAPLGWILLLLSLVDVGMTKWLTPYSGYVAWGAVGLILLFSAPGAGILGRLGSGVWALYGITGIFGDLLSYIRLFALGIASAILGLVVNSIAWQIYGSSDILGPILFVVFLLVGHTLNLLIASLGAFVHPMRLTFVEFYKNAGFEGGGKPYDPLRRQG